jgi:hypothetical protein
VAISRASDSSIQDGLPKYNDIWDGTTATSAFDSLGVVVVGSGGLASITFSNIPQTYTHLQIRGTAQDNRATYNTSSLDMRFNGDTAANYSDHVLQASWTAGSGAAQAFSDVSNTAISWSNQITSTVATNVFGAFIIDILDYTSTIKSKTTRSLTGADANADASGFRPVPRFASGNWRKNTSSVYEGITSITFTSGFGSIISQYSQLALYGIK